MPIRVSLEAPCLIVRFSGTVSDAEYARYLEDLRMRLTGRLGEARRLALVNDAREGFRASKDQNARHSQWLKMHRTLLNKTIACTAFVVADEYGQSVINMVTRENQAAATTRAFLDYQEAIDWARGYVARDGITSVRPPSMRPKS